MSDKTGISWTDATWNPTRGCTVVSPGCTNCYAMSVAARLSGPGQAYEGLAEVKNGHAVWTGELMFVEKHLNDPIRWKRPRRIFVNSMSDLFHERIPDEWLDRIFDVMEQAPKHHFQILTKRPERMCEYMCRRAMWWTVQHKVYTVNMRRIDQDAARLYARDNPHIWLGVSVERQREADERIPTLLETPAAVRFLSCEPLLGPLDLDPWIWGNRCPDPECMDSTWDHACGLGEQRLHWVIVGGESGPRFRPMNPDWARALYLQCATAGVPFFYKQSSALKSGTDPYLDGVKIQQFPAELVPA